MHLWGPRPPGDLHRRGGVRLAAGCALLFGTLAVLVDWDAGTLTGPRAALWLTLTATLFAVLLPPRVTAGPGRLTVHGPLGRRTVRTDSLRSVRRHDGVTTRLVLRDTDGHHVELDARVLATDPFLRHEVDTGVRRSLERGTLRQGELALRRLTEEIDGETVEAVLRASGMS
ncbi:PH domain-containing protein [Streptomyces sp. DSM 15324]|uniref:PH domain-containing protein n=1 Tax=Streptomyces sp. DSM 15324 TaxID=1739111 RepID=UPI000748C757|nr:PH domain-containing protein [Streptomyces sp. DSM 15324]KUO12672.1 hypothetical protein AQJ58_07715 [Streptomyces sp. DSM 15324]